MEKRILNPNQFKDLDLNDFMYGKITRAVRDSDRDSIAYFHDGKFMAVIVVSKVNQMTLMVANFNKYGSTFDRDRTYNQVDKILSRIDDKKIVYKAATSPLNYCMMQLNDYSFYLPFTINGASNKDRIQTIISCCDEIVSDVLQPKFEWLAQREYQEEITAASLRAEKAFIANSFNDAVADALFDNANLFKLIRVESNTAICQDPTSIRIILEVTNPGIKLDNNFSFKVPHSTYLSEMIGALKFFHLWAGNHRLLVHEFNIVVECDHVTEAIKSINEIGIKLTNAVAQLKSTKSAETAKRRDELQKTRDICEQINSIINLSKGT